MTATNMQEKLHHYIDTVELRKVNSMYTMIEDSLEAETIWTDEFKKEVDRRYAEYKKTGKSVSEDQANKRIQHILQTERKQK